ncbi:alpha/beta hydrolase [Peribacillus asahii]|uniref:Alpha/beta hydrolase n=1 Tax=Peribacillus asahii TaxID=228899 RepID=A0A398B367_9BACI|nr:alpha/beta hydrolase [Peribacillus asahii]RID84021.1 alpha/beta hydrolase [Peribacillus asahii]
MNLKEAIIFLHGVVGNKNVFKTEIDTLKGRYNCIAYDYYNSENLGADCPFSLELLLQQLYDQYKRNGIQKAHLCTLSFGCIVAMAFNKKYPEMVMSLTFVGGYFCGVPSTLHKNRIKLLKEKPQYDHKAWLKRYASAINPNKKQIQENSEAIFVKNALLLHPNVFEKAIRVQLEYDSRMDLMNVKRPILWVMGEYDELYKETLADLEQYVPHVEYHELQNAGHVAHIHQPDQFMSIFQPFLKKASNQRSLALELIEI